MLLQNPVIQNAKEARAINTLHPSLPHESDTLQYQIPQYLLPQLFPYLLQQTTWSNYEAFLKRLQVFLSFNNKEKVHLYGFSLNSMQEQSLIYLHDWHSSVHIWEHRLASLNWERFISDTDWANRALHLPTDAGLHEFRFPYEQMNSLIMH